MLRACVRVHPVHACSSWCCSPASVQQAGGGAQCFSVVTQLPLQGLLPSSGVVSSQPVSRGCAVRHENGATGKAMFTDRVILETTLAGNERTPAQAGE